MADLSTAEDNARAAFSRDPKERVAITAEEACTLFDRLAEAEATLAIVRREFSGPVRPTHHRCPHCAIAAGDTERAWIDAEQYALQAWKEHLGLMAARAEIAQIRRDRDERPAACVRGEQHQRERNADLIELLAETEARMHAAEGEIAVMRDERARLVAHCDEANANAPRPLTDALDDIARLANERDRLSAQLAVCEEDCMELAAVANHFAPDNLVEVELLVESSTDPGREVTS